LSTLKVLGELARNKPLLGAIVTVVVAICLTLLILVGCFNVSLSLKTQYFDISIPAKQSATPKPVATSIQDNRLAASSANGGSPSSEQKSSPPAVIATSCVSSEPVGRSSPVTPSVLVIPVGTTLAESLTLLPRRKFTRSRVQGGELFGFRQNAFGLNWDVSELFRNDVAVSATLTRSIFAEGREGTPTWAGDILEPVSTFCFGTGYQSLRNYLDTSMQLISGQLDDEKPAQLEVSLFQPCPDGKDCHPEWVTRYGDWTYRAPGMRDVTLSIGKSEYVQYEFASGGYDRTVLHRQRCEMRLVFSGQNAPTVVPLSMLP
jgi:hypothetical protein